MRPDILDSYWLVESGGDHDRNGDPDPSDNDDDIILSPSSSLSSTNSDESSYDMLLSFHTPILSSDPDSPAPQHKHDNSTLPQLQIPTTCTYRFGPPTPPQEPIQVEDEHEHENEIEHENEHEPEFGPLREPEPELELEPEPSLSSTLYYFGSTLESTSPGIVNVDTTEKSNPSSSSSSTASPSSFFQSVCEYIDDRKKNKTFIPECTPSEEIVIPQFHIKDGRDISDLIRILFIGQWGLNLVPSPLNDDNNDSQSMIGSIEGVVEKVSTALNMRLKKSKDWDNKIVREYIYERNKGFDEKEKKKKIILPRWLDNDKYNSIPTVAFTYNNLEESLDSIMLPQGMLHILKQNNIPLFSIEDRDEKDNENFDRSGYFSLAAPHIRQLSIKNPHHGGILEDNTKKEDCLSKGQSWYARFPMNFNQFYQMTDDSLKTWIFQVVSGDVDKEDIQLVNPHYFLEDKMVDDDDTMKTKGDQLRLKYHQIREYFKLRLFLLAPLIFTLVAIYFIFLKIQPQIQYSVLSLSSNQLHHEGPAFYLDLLSLSSKSATNQALGNFNAGQIITSCPARHHPLLSTYNGDVDNNLRDNNYVRVPLINIERDYNQVVVGNIAIIPILYNHERFVVLPDIQLSRTEPGAVVMRRLTMMDVDVDENNIDFGDLSGSIDLDRACLAIIEIKKSLRNKLAKFLHAAEAEAATTNTDSTMQLSKYLNQLAHVDLKQIWKNCYDNDDDSNNNKGLSKSMDLVKVRQRGRDDVSRNSHGSPDSYDSDSRSPGAGSRGLDYHRLCKSFQKVVETQGDRTLTVINQMCTSVTISLWPAITGWVQDTSIIWQSWINRGWSLWYSSLLSSLSSSRHKLIRLWMNLGQVKDKMMAVKVTWYELGLLSDWKNELGPLGDWKNGILEFVRSQSVPDFITSAWEWVCTQWSKAQYAERRLWNRLMVMVGKDQGSPILD